jgi:ATP-dependent DNA helicase RecQ
MINKVSGLNGAMRDTSATESVIIGAGAYRPNLRYEVERVGNEGEKRLSLAPLLKGTEGSGVIYAATVREARALADYLERAGFNVAAHGQLEQPEVREKSEERLLSGALKAIIAVSDSGPTPAGMDPGMDTCKDIERPDIRFVIHYNMPSSLEAYYRESARAGRDGRPSRCVLLFQIDDRRARVFALNGKSPKPEEVVAVYGALETLGADRVPASLELIQTSAIEAPRIKVRAILSLLKNMGFIKEHRGARYTLLKRDLGEQELRRLANEYTSKGESDREKLERMTLYAQSPECRWKLMLEHLGAHMGQTEQTGPMVLRGCGHCDNCSLAVAEQARAPESVARPDFIDLLFAKVQREELRIRPGDVVKLPAHGEVKVKAIEGDKIVVSLPDGEIRKFKREWIIR